MKRNKRRLEPDVLPKKRSKGWWGCVAFIAFLVLVGAMSVLGTAGFGLTLYTRSQLAVKRYCFKMSGDQLYEDGSGDTNGVSIGTITVDPNLNRITYELIFDDIETPDSMHIHGPVTRDNLKTAGVAIPSDGSSLDVTVLDDTFIQGTEYITHSLARKLIQNPMWYYISIKTETYPTGAIGARLGTECERNY
jgi:hypothetical protein